MRIVPFLLAATLAASSVRADEVIEVHDAPKQPGEEKIPAREAARMPGAFGDPLRAVESMPGVVPLFSGIPYFYVRGAPPSANGYSIDGVTIPLLFHIGAGPSVLAPGLVDEVSFHPSVAPVSLGRYAGGFIAARTRPAPAFAHVEASVRVFDLAALAETKAGAADVLVAGRYGNPNPILSLVGSNVGLEYGDYQTRVGYRLGERDRISAFAFGASDALSDGDGPILATHFHRVDLRWDHAFASGGGVRFAVTLGTDYTDNEDRSGSGVDATATMRGIGARVELDRPLAAALRLRAGADAWRMRMTSETRVWGGVSMTGSHDASPMGAWLELVATPSAGIEIIPGIRIDRYLATEDVQRSYYMNRQSFDLAYPGVDRLGVDPRLRTRVRLAEGVSWVSALGVAHQGPEYVAPIPGVHLSSTSTRLQESFQIAQGLEFALPAKIALSVAGFRNVVRHVRDLVVACTEDDHGPRDTVQIGARVLPQMSQMCGQGDGGDVLTHGLELLVRRDLSKRVGGMLAYTLSRSVRDDGTLTRYDRAHVLSAILSVSLGRGWRAGGRFAYETGRPYRGVLAVTGQSGIPFERRLPDFHRLDMRLEKAWNFGDDARLAVVLEVFNATLQREPTAYTQCSATTGCTLQSIGPVTIPSIGLEGAM